MRIKFSKSKAKLHPIAVEPKVLGHQVSPNIACSINQSNFMCVTCACLYNQPNEAYIGVGRKFEVYMIRDAGRSKLLP